MRNFVFLGYKKTNKKYTFRFFSYLFVINNAPFLSSLLHLLLGGKKKKDPIFSVTTFSLVVISSEAEPTSPYLIFFVAQSNFDKDRLLLFPRSK